uniref:ParB family protein n=1 Tax=Cryobacterium sp. TaxID=1926290 RepID=UPI001597B25E|nr:hypothetical protein [Cryobacterium sp.]QJS06010.1 hypothetical protein [Cryobacterium sp.]
MNRPAPRKSSLTGSSPIAPPAPAAAEPAAPAAAAPAAAEVKQPAPATKAKSTPAAKPAAATDGKKKYPPKVSFYQDPEDTGRVRGAILHTQVAEGSRSLSQFIAEAVMEKVEALEAKYNNGEPFPAIGARELPQGRPMGE